MINSGQAENNRRYFPSDLHDVIALHCSCTEEGPLGARSPAASPGSWCLRCLGTGAGRERRRLLRCTFQLTLR